MQRRGDKSVATADVEEGTGGGKPLEQGQEAGVAMGKPERAVLKRKAVVIARRRIGDRLRAAPAPNPVRILLQAIREKSQVELRMAILANCRKESDAQPLNTGFEPIRAPESAPKLPSFFADRKTGARAGTKQAVFNPESIELSMPKTRRFVTSKK